MSENPCSPPLIGYNSCKPYKYGFGRLRRRTIWEEVHLHPSVCSTILSEKKIFKKKIMNENSDNYFFIYYHQIITVFIGWKIWPIWKNKTVIKTGMYHSLLPLIVPWEVLFRHWLGRRYWGQLQQTTLILCTGTSSYIYKWHEKMVSKLWRLTIYYKKSCLLGKKENLELRLLNIGIVPPSHISLNRTNTEQY